MMTQMQSSVQNQMSDRGSMGSNDGEAAQAELPAVCATPEAGGLDSFQDRPCYCMVRRYSRGLWPRRFLKAREK